MRRSALSVNQHRTESSQQPGSDDHEDDDRHEFPENSREAWLCLLGSFFMMLPSFGFQTAGVQVGPLFDRYGARILVISGSLASFLCYMLLAQCSEYWHFMLCLGVLGGMSSAVITTVSIAVLSHWFYRRRGLASGICMAGSSTGGAIIPLLLRTLFQKYGWLWSIRIIAFLALGCYALGVFLIKGRPPTSSSSSSSSDNASRATIDFRAFSSPRLCFLAMAVFSFEFIIFGCAALLPTYVRYAGLSEDVQFYSLTLLNGMSLLGRVLPGFAADQVGRFNTLVSMVCITLVIMAAVWLPFGSHDSATLLVVVAIFGFGSGGWLSLAPVCAGQLCRTQDYGRFYGTIYSVASFGVLLTVPVGGKLLQSTTPKALIGFYSAVLLAGLENANMFWRNLAIAAGLLGTAGAQQFLEPSGADGSITYTVGETVGISWNGTSDYSMLSLGLQQSNSDDTTSWLLSNSVSYPDYISWTATLYAFSLNSSELFHFIIVNGTEMGSPFYSPLFYIREASSSTATTTSTGTASSTSATATATASPSSTSSAQPTSNGLTTGAKAGIGVGVSIAGLAIIALLVWFALRQRRRQGLPVSQTQTQAHVHVQEPPQLLDSRERKQLFASELPGA
ncbi:hypothetical protein UA08_03319 [Talaromyces atroroseus]|uniref:Major facilitator superfamily (MFS) profile domain-containing protein n=1 Tax=Talaromyces atroroseus TaxID=1441469 RepID=A0A225AUW9_TALAT|nr:hypothetical protein UA08_03319 [Talaromyces atroroseus]OKL61098.1 hypothetical protein UA08_03319 [Talaromyces atroroseus]